MTSYWDSSALVAATLDPRLRLQLETDDAVTRSHSAAEMFSALTGSRLGFRVGAQEASRLIRSVLSSLHLVKLSPAQIFDALDEAQLRGVRGGRVHDYLHALAARSSGCQRLVTLNTSDFLGLFDGLEIVPPQTG